MRHLSFGLKTLLYGVVISAFTAGPAVAQEARELRVLTFGGSLGSGFMEAVKGFESEFNVKLVQSQATGAQGITRLIARHGQEPEWDVVHMSPSSHFQGAEAGIWESMSPETVPNMKDLAKAAIDRDQYVGWGLVAFGIEVNTEALKEAGAPEPKAWKDLWNPAYRGRVAIEDFSNSFAQAFFDVISQLEGSQDAAFEALAKLRPNICCFPMSVAEVENYLAQKDAWIAATSDSRANLAAAKGAPIKFIYPEEGAAAWLLHLDVPKLSPNRELAYEFVNYVLRPDVQAKLAASAQVGPVNTKAELDEKTAATVASGEKIAAMRPLRWSEVVPNLNELTDRWVREFQQ